MRLRRLFFSIAVALTLAGLAGAQPIPVEGTEMVPNEYGGMFPREIIWERDGAVMVLVPFGEFRIGLDREEGGRPNEAPQRTVYLSSFYIDKHEVTQRMYERFQRIGTAARPRPSGNPEIESPERPVVAIPWTSAESYAAWARKQLPTEVQWEKAARGEDGRLFPTGNSFPGSDVLICDQGSNGMPVFAREDTGDVSPYGVFHMGGNVAEWTATWYDRDYYVTMGTRDPVGPEAGETRVVRGGSFFSDPEDTRVTLRIGQPPSLFLDNIGFRTVWVPEPPPDPEEIARNATPTPIPPPTTEELLEELRLELVPFLERGTPELPDSLMASRAYLTGEEALVQFINFTPFRLSLNFVGPDEGFVFKYNEPIVPMSYRNVALPTERNLYVLAYASEAPNPGPVNLGFVRAEAKAQVVIKSEQFIPVTTDGGKVLKPEETGTAEQYYSRFLPRWNEMEVYNTLSEPVLLSYDDVTAGKDRPVPQGEFLLEAGQLFLMTELRRGEYLFRADYIGATEESSTPVEVIIDDNAARRLLLVSQTAVRGATVTVITEEKPMLDLSVTNAREVAFPRD